MTSIAAYGAGYTGAGQTIAVIGQSAVVAFRHHEFSGRRRSGGAGAA